MQKPPLAKAQTALGKRKKHPVEGWYLFHFQNSVKKAASSHKFSLKSGNRLLSHGQQ